MTDNITITGLVATIPNNITTNEGLAISSFRLASTQRRFDRTKNAWVDGDTNWYSVTSFRQLAANCTVSIKKGDRVIVSGRLHIREWANGDKKGINVEVEADALGHDLTWGTASYSRSISARSLTADDTAAANSLPTDASADSGDDEPVGVDAWATAPVGAAADATPF